MADIASNEAAQLHSTRSLGALGMFVSSVGVGIIGGLGAVIFRAMIALFHNVFFEWKWSLAYDANVFTSVGHWGPWVILVPIVGSVGVSLLVTRFAPEAKGHGVPEVMESVYFKKGIMRPVVVWIKALASALCIGTGGSVGREGPIIQIGSAMGSWMAQKARLAPWQRIVLLACGAGAGIAATFNTPIGGVLFAVEIILHEVSVRTLVPVAVATATASYVGRLFFGLNPSFVIPAFESSYFQPAAPFELLGYCVLGGLLGILSSIFIKSIYGFEDFFEKRISGGYFARHGLGMAGVGLLIYLTARSTGHYYVEGVGYSTVQAILTGALSSVPLLCGLLVLKLLVTSLTLGSGGSGGIFSPSLYLGAACGAAFGTALGHLVPSLLVSPPAFAVSGMAGMVGGVTGAAVTAIVMVFEMTRDYNVVIPMTLTVAVAYGVRTALSRQSIYTMKLYRRGEVAPDALYTNIHMMRPAAEFMTGAALVDARQLVKEFTHRLSLDGAPRAAISAFMVVQTDGKISGVVTSGHLMRAMLDNPQGTLHFADLANKNLIIIRQSDILLNVIRLMHEKHADFAVAVALSDIRLERPLGVITQKIVGRAFIESSDVLSS